MHSNPPDLLGTSKPGQLHPIDLDRYVAHLRPLLIPWFIAFCVGSWLVNASAPPWALGAWMLSYLVLFGVRIICLNRYTRLDLATKRDKQAYWRNLLEYSSLLHGSFWGVFVWMSLPDLPVFRQFLVTWIVVVAGALAAVTIPVGAVSLRSYLLCMLGPACAAWWMYGGPDGYWMSVVLLLLISVYGEIWKRYGSEMRERVADMAKLALANEVLEKSHASKTSLLVEAGHDLRQPVHVLGMMLEAVDTQGPREDIARRLQEVQTCVDSISNMLIDLLDLARLEASEYVLELEPVSIKALLRELEQVYAPLAQRKGLDWIVTQSSAWGLSDVTMLRRVMNNLITNAIKYTSSGSIGIHCFHEAGSLKILVSDTGDGIPADKVDLIFKEYVRLDDASPIPGYGIGLAVVKRMLELLGHDLSVTSRPGEGSRFLLEMTAVQGPDVEAVAPPPNNKDPKPWLGRLFVFIENDEQLLASTAQVLTAWGAQVVAASSISQALESPLLYARRPDLLLSDMHLGGGATGLEAIDSMRSKYSTAQLPAILLTGDMTNALQVETRAKNIRIAYKPVRPSLLRDVVNIALAEQGA